MPSLILIGSPVQPAPLGEVPLHDGPQVIGRDSKNAQIHIPHDSVSRTHARITARGGVYYIEDLNSRNATYVNRARLSPHSPVPLRPNDRVKICDFLFQFRDERPPAPAHPTSATRKTPPEIDLDPSGTVAFEASQRTVHADDLLQAAPAERLRALLDISKELYQTLELPPLFARIADALMRVFRQADRCFVIQIDDAGRHVAKVAKTRYPTPVEPRFSRTIVGKTIESRESFLSEDAPKSRDLGPAESVNELHIRSAISAPLLTAAGVPLGAIQLDTLNRARKFTTDDLNLLTTVANLASMAFEKARMHEESLRAQRDRASSESAKSVQRGLLPQMDPVVDGYCFYAHYSPAEAVGGDYYDFVPLPGNRLAVLIGDVCGKGVPGAILMAKLSSEVKFCLATEPNLATAVTRLNDQMIRGGIWPRYVTLTAMVLDPIAHQVTVVNAGHPKPKVFRDQRGELSDIVSEEVHGFPIGIVAGHRYKATSVVLEPGDTITLYTDGVTDARNRYGEQFGSGRTDRCLALDGSFPLDHTRPRRVGERLVEEVRRHAAGEPQFDDIAVVCFCRLEQERVTHTHFPQLESGVMQIPRDGTEGPPSRGGKPPTGAPRT